MAGCLPVHRGDRVAAAGRLEHQVVEPVVAVGDGGGRFAPLDPRRDALAEPLDERDALGVEVLGVRGEEAGQEHAPQHLQLRRVARGAPRQELDVVERRVAPPRAVQAGQFDHRPAGQFRRSSR